MCLQVVIFRVDLMLLINDGASLTEGVHPQHSPSASAASYHVSVIRACAMDVTLMMNVYVDFPVLLYESDG